MSKVSSVAAAVEQIPDGAVLMIGGFMGAGTPPLLIDELVGAPMSEAEWKRLVAEIGPRLGQLRIAHVKPLGLDTVEYCVLSAMGAGLDARVFEDERAANLWLHYGPPVD